MLMIVQLRKLLLATVFLFGTSPWCKVSMHSMQMCVVFINPFTNDGFTTKLYFFQTKWR